MAKKPAKKIEFEWEGKDAKGQKTRGRMQGQNADIVKAQLRRKGIVPLKVKKRSGRSVGGKITAGDISLFARQLTTMMSSGVPMVQAFEIVGNGSDNPAMKDLLMSIKTDVEGGGTLAGALAKYPEHFDRLFCSLVEAGEQSGTLETLLEKIASYKEKTESLKGKIKKALFYPAAVCVIALIVTSILLIFVVPQFEQVFRNVGSDLPAFTKMVVRLSELMQAYWYIVLAIIVGTIMTITHLIKTSKKFSDFIDRLSLKLPIVGTILNKASIARFARTLSTMSAAGVPLVEAMTSVAGAAGNSVYEKAILKMKDDASTGQRLNISMQNLGIFPNMVVQMVGIGEEAGSLDDMLAKVADYYEEEVDNAVDGLTSLLEPLIMAFLGVVVGGLVIAMYLPIFKMADAF